MSAFTLHRQAYSQGAFTVCYVRQEGGSRQHFANAHLSTGRLGDFATVDLPAGAVTVNQPHRDPDWINSATGYAMWDFTSHQDAIDFLCHLYGITTAEDAEGQPLEASADTLNRVLRTVPAFPLLRRDCYLITLLGLSTGARWSEAQTLRGENVGKDRVTFVATKSGKTRTVPISPYLAGQLRHRCRIGRLFRDAYNPFRRAIKDLAITLPEGQLTHVLRHTFASHFMMNGGNILVLQRILGHQSITMTMRYAHFAPDHLEDAVKLNPVATLGDVVKM